MQITEETGQAILSTLERVAESLERLPAVGTVVNHFNGEERAFDKCEVADGPDVEVGPPAKYAAEAAHAAGSDRQVALMEQRDRLNHLQRELASLEATRQEANAAWNAAERDLTSQAVACREAIGVLDQGGDGDDGIRRG